MVYETYSKRQSLQRGEAPDVFQYNYMSAKLKQQIIFAFENSKLFYDTYSRIVRILREERGVRRIGEVRFNPYGSSKSSLEYDTEELYDYFLNEKNVEFALDVVELFCRLNSKSSGIAHCISVINKRFLENSFGYQIENSTIVRIDSTVVHSDIIKPALYILSDKKFDAANSEYMLAHEHFRHERYEDSIVNCLKALESTIKIIINFHKFPVPLNATIKVLIGFVFEQEILPKYLQSHFSGLRSCLESGVPTVRNQAGGHGRGMLEPPPAYLAQFLLHQTATNIILLSAASDKWRPPATELTKNTNG